MTEFVKYGTPTLGFEVDLATFVQVSNKKQVSLMFNRGARIPGADPAEAQARAAELGKIVTTWFSLPASKR